VVQRREIMQSHLARRDFVAVAATDDAEQLVGFGYGYRGQPGDWWHDVVARALGKEKSKEWLRDSFEVAELHVEPAWHGRGLGRQILETLLSRATGASVVLSTHDRESAARNLYRSVGFADLLQAFYFPGSTEMYVIMGLRRQGPRR
jgi:ribosomal protein S18 acetylase RimI-like enzyme